ncbi:hypothetical protein NitYY0826_C1978 [Nitratiruptor sp. YY08-26]|uniref:hypothetical protein n=1 Tax=unclassified Nitratiruptor TaxID=2624044 RepID=UPI001916467E|nr:MULTISPECIES: hypothetical protein [unclassified Nitratiruptor]BCD63088.1 hypothetical protein NitYY0813_C1976 [Nitratiruptor sp. YY08-13]BCD67023.1 hypothetical protein NitYY0826_C1978 [Nitratiruptor sp. YY08-26]
MRKIHLSLVSAVVLAGAITSGASAGVLEDIISNPKVSLEIRPRFEYVDQDGISDEANAVTVRTALGLNTALFGVEGLGAQLQVMNVTALNDDYAPENDSGHYPVVADPEQTRVTQANVSYAANGFVGIVGRKMVVLDNARFIGNVGWRQMPQTYDLAAVIYNGVENLSLLGAYVWNVNRIFNADGDGPKKKHLSTGSVLLHASYKVSPALNITAYDYMIENLMDHIGLRLTGKFDLNDVKLSYVAEYALQDDPSLDDSDDPLYSPNREQDTEYYNLALNAKYNAFVAGIGFEHLGDKGSGDMAFTTPLATLHAMNGWADVFLGTPAEGLEDLSVKLGYNFGEYGNIVAIYHSFSSDSNNAAGDDDLGDELDIAYKYKINKNLGLLLKYADYNAGDASFGKKDVTKYWVQLDYKFSAEL